MASEELDLSQSAAGLVVPWKVLAGGFTVFDGHVVPITNGVMGPGKEIIKLLGAMYGATKIADGDTRSQVLDSLADQVLVSAGELKSSVGSISPG